MHARLLPSLLLLLVLSSASCGDEGNPDVVLDETPATDQAPLTEADCHDNAEIGNLICAVLRMRSLDECTEDYEICRLVASLSCSTAPDCPPNPECDVDHLICQLMAIEAYDTCRDTVAFEYMLCLSSL